jgi:hypothetical protein
VIISKKFFNGLYLHRRKFFAAAGASMLILMFQNCGGPGMTSASLAGSSSGSSTSASTNSGGGSSGGGITSGGGSTTPPTPTPTPAPTPAPTGLTLDQQRANCNSAIGAPSNLVVTSGGNSANAATISSGLGATNSGDSPDAMFDISINRGVTNAAVYNSTDNRCDSHVGVNLICDVVDTDPTNYPLSILNGVDTAGKNLLASMTPLKAAQGSIDNNKCKAAFSPGASKVSFYISPNTRAEKCVQGSFWLKLTVQNSVTGIAGVKSSAPQYFKVNVNNGCWVESRLKDPAGDFQRVVNFGTAVSISGAWAAVLAPTEDSADATPVLDVGAVYLFKNENGNWVKKDKIMIPGAIAGESLGSIALNGDSLVIGSPYRNNGQGGVYFFRRNVDTWSQVGSVITPNNADSNQNFGQSVAINASQIFVSSPNYSLNVSKGGAVGVYTYSASGMSSVPAQFIVGAVANAGFGLSLSADSQQSLLAVGAPQAVGKESLAAGSVFVYKDAGTNNYSLVATKVGTQVSEKFGGTVALYSGHLAAGSPNFTNDSTKGYGNGRVTYYDMYTDSKVYALFSDGTAGDNYGKGLALSPRGIFIGAPFGMARAGFVDFYRYQDMTATSKTLYYRNTPYNNSTNSAFGNAIAASGDDVVIGARIKNDPNDNSGAGYIYKFK